MYQNKIQIIYYKNLNKNKKIKYNKYNNHQINNNKL